MITFLFVYPIRVFVQNLIACRVDQHDIRTSDSDFDELLPKFVAAAKAGEQMLKAWETQLKWLDDQQHGINVAMEAVETACGTNTNVPAVALILYAWGKYG